MTVQTRPPALLPGIPVAGLHAAPPPHQLLERGTLLLSNATPGTTVGLEDHQRFWGPLPAAQLADLIAAAERTALAGAGGAGFPTARKLQSMVGTRTGLSSSTAPRANQPAERTPYFSPTCRIWCWTQR